MIYVRGHKSLWQDFRFVCFLGDFKSLELSPITPTPHPASISNTLVNYTGNNERSRGTGKEYVKLI